MKNLSFIMKRITLAALIVIILLGGFLRFYKISSNPPGLYIDEAGIALNAYDIATTGRDEYGTPFPLTFRSFDDYKMPGYIYFTALSLKVFGKNEFAVRFPSATAGTATIIVFFFLIRTLLMQHTSTKKYADQFALLGGLLLAIMPWHLLISRGGFEVTVALFFYALGILLAIQFWKKEHVWLLIWTIIFLILAMYTYHSYRIISPITIFAGLILALKDKRKRNLVLSGIFLFFLLSLPLLIFTFTPNGEARFSQTSAFADDPFTGIARLPVDIFIFLKNYYSYFSLTYLFSYGDQINRHQLNNFGLLYLWQLPYIVGSLYFLGKTKNKVLRLVILFLLFVGPLPAALARPSPHSLRFLLGTIVFTFLTVLGIYQLFLQKNKRIVQGIFLMTIIIACIEFAYYTHLYFIQYPRLAILDWGGGCKAVAEKIYSLRNDYKRIYIDKNLGCVSEYFTFYIPTVHITYLSSTQTVSSSQGTTLYIRPYYGGEHSNNVFYVYRLPVQNNTIFAEFWKL